MERRDVLRLSAVAGATGALTLGRVSFADATPTDGRSGGGPGEQTRQVTGHLPTGSPDFVYLPVEVPGGVREIAVAYRYDKPTVPEGTAGNACDIGIFDERGTDLGGAGFRGWSGGARTEFFLRADEATPAISRAPSTPAPGISPSARTRSPHRACPTTSRSP